MKKREEKRRNNTHDTMRTYVICIKIKMWSITNECAEANKKSRQQRQNSKTEETTMRATTMSTSTDDETNDRKLSNRV